MSRAAKNDENFCPAAVFDSERPRRGQRRQRHSESGAVASSSFVAFSEWDSRPPRHSGRESRTSAANKSLNHHAVNVAFSRCRFEMPSTPSRWLRVAPTYAAAPRAMTPTPTPIPAARPIVAFSTSRSIQIKPRTEKRKCRFTWQE